MKRELGIARRVGAGLSCIVAAAAAAPARAAIYPIVDLGVLTVTNDGPRAINDSGKVAMQLNGAPYVYENGALTLLAPRGAALGVNNLGVVSGFANSAGPSHAFQWDANGTPTDVDAAYAQPGDVSYGQGINNLGQIIGYASAPLGYLARIWSNGSRTTLGGIRASNPQSQGFAINDAAIAVGSATHTSGYEHAFAWQSGTMTDLGTLPTYDSSQAWGINDNNTIVGMAEGSFGGSTSDRPVRWVNSLPINMGSPFGSFPNGYARGINNAEQVVGTSFSSLGSFGPSNHAWVWQNGAFVDLDTLVGGSGWHLYDAYDINNTGRIVGLGRLNGQDHGFVLLAPEPGAVTMLGLPATISLLAARPSRRRRGRSITSRSRTDW